MYWHQRSRLNYLRFGDKITRFFHITATQRRQRNLILHLKNELLTPKSTSNKVCAEQNVRLCRGICIEEIKSAMFDLGSLKAPEPDGFPGLFYQKYWDHVKDSVGDMAIWKQRNDRIFSNTHPDPLRLIRQAHGVHGEFLAPAYSKANVPARTIEDRNDQTWQRPPNDRWKFNCDGAYNPSDKSAAFAVLVRNSDGALADINHGRIKVSSALAAEAWAV
ncbi:hypothetical protein RHGRI_031077 [Rhododendron griersonianum]|uniref:RNase H type-1 domain-containing protein n=1 Tax=Rhododendron griersonianum TaxID=479676 RepID=A0AAV6I9W3_9ERIC|nr:hypothetical protein RHGRI_031077 [Rhododendron griersonianum]